MPDLDDRISTSLKRAGNSYTPVPAPVEAFDSARRRSTLVRTASGVAVAAAIVLFAFVSWPGEEVDRDAAPVGPIPVPRGPIHIDARIAVKPQPLGLTVDGAHVFVGHSEGSGMEAIDPDSGEVIYRVAPPGDTPPQFLAAGPSGIWKAHVGSLDLYVPSTMGAPPPAAQRSVKIGQPSDLAYGDRYLWVATSDPADRSENYPVMQIDVKDLSVDHKFFGAQNGPPFRSFTHIDYGFGALWVAVPGAGGAGGLVRIDPESGSAEPVSGVLSTSDVAVGPSGVWVYDNSRATEGRVMHVDPETLEVDKTVSFDGFFGRLEADENGVWVLNSTSETDRQLVRLDPETGEKLGSLLQLGAGPFEMTSGFGAIWISDAGKAEVLKVTLGSGPIAVEKKIETYNKLQAQVAALKAEIRLMKETRQTRGDRARLNAAKEKLKDLRAEIESAIHRATHKLENARPPKS